MKIINALRYLLMEQEQLSKFQVLFDKYAKPEKVGKKTIKPKIPFKELKTLIVGDPTTKVREGFDYINATPEQMTNDNVHIGKYINWLIRSYLKPPVEDGIQFGTPAYTKAVKGAQSLFFEDLYKTTDDLKKFERAKQYLPQESRDINKFNPHTLYDVLKDFKLPEKKGAELEKKEAKKSREGLNHKGGIISFEGAHWTVVKIEDKGPIGKDAACYYGGFNEETRWCTSGPGLTYFDTYIKQGPLYVIFANNDNGKVGQKTGLPTERYQFHFPSSQFMDKEDRSVKLIELLNGPMAELKEYFKPEFAKGIVEGTDGKLNVQYPNSAAGKYVVLYGFDELFNSVPANIGSIHISNESQENIAIDVPPTLGRFKNLTTLFLKKICKSLPKEISALKKLEFLSLADNPQLKELPKEVDTLPQLQFITVKDTGVKKLSSSITSRFSLVEEVWVINDDLETQ